MSGEYEEFSKLGEVEQDVRIEVAWSERELSEEEHAQKYFRKPTVDNDETDLI